MATFSGVNAAKNWFFDRAEVTKRVNAARLKVLSRMGAYVRTRAQRSLRYRKAVSPPGQPPSVHRTADGVRTDRKTGRRVARSFSPLREFLYFAYDPAADSVVVGPAATNQVFFSNQARNTVRGRVPEILEKGGSLTVLEWKSHSDGQWYRADLRSKRRLADHQLRYRMYTHQPRPFMAPAEAAERPKFAGMFQNSLRKAG